MIRSSFFRLRAWIFARAFIKSSPMIDVGATADAVAGWGVGEVDCGGSVCTSSVCGSGVGSGTGSETSACAGVSGGVDSGAASCGGGSAGASLTGSGGGETGSLGGACGSAGGVEVSSGILIQPQDFPTTR